MVIKEPSSWHLPLSVECYPTSQLWAVWLFYAQEVLLCVVFYDFIWDKFGSDLNKIWPTSTCTGRVDRWSTPVIFTVRALSDLSDSPSKCTAATGDNGASNCSQVECCYLYANEVGSINFISIEKSTHTYLEFLLLVFSFVRCLFCPCACIWLTVMKGRWWENTLVIMGSSCFAANTDESLDMDRKCQSQNYCFVLCHRGTVVTLVGMVVLKHDNK